MRYKQNDPAFCYGQLYFRQRFFDGSADRIFGWILNEIETIGYLTSKIVYVNGMHIKVKANLNKTLKQVRPKVEKVYELQLMKEINKGTVSLLLTAVRKKKRLFTEKVREEKKS